MKKRALALVLALVMVLSLLPMTAFAAETETFAIGEIKAITLDYDAEVKYTFTADKKGEVVIYAEYNEAYNEKYDYNYGWAPQLRIQATDGSAYSNYMDVSGYNAQKISVEAGKTYEIVLENTDECKATYIGAVGLAYVTPAESFEIEYYEKTGFVGDYIYGQVKISPEPCFDSVTWTSSDESVLDVWGNSTYFHAEAKKAGTATITGTTGSGKSVSATITVKERETIKVGDSKTLSLQAEDSMQYTFTAEKSGNVVAYMPYGDNVYVEGEGHYGGAFDFNIRAEDHSGYSSNANNGRYSAAVMAVEAGKTYVLTVSNYIPAAYSGTFYLEEAKAAESVTISGSLTGFVGNDVHLQAVVSPETSFETCTWEISDPTVLKYNGGNGSTFWGEALKTGTVTVKVTTSSGKTASTTVTIKEKEKLNLGDSKSLTLKPDEKMEYTFTAKKTGKVVLYMPYNNDYYSTAFDIEMRSDDHEWSEGVNNDTYTGTIMDVVAGETYHVYVYNYYEDTVSGTITLEEAKPAEGVEIYNYTSTVFVGERFGANAKCTPDTSFDTCTWKVSDTSMVEENWSYSSYFDGTALKTGTFTLTVTSSNGKTDSVTITVKEPGTINIGESKTLTLQSKERMAYTFTADKTGKVICYVPAGEKITVGDSYYYTNFNTWMEGKGEVYSNYVSTDKYEGAVMDVVAGETYTLYVGNYWGYPVTATVTLAYNQPLQSFTLSRSEFTLPMGYRLYLDAIPVPGESFNAFEWSSSDESVCTVQGYGAYSNVFPVSAGTATITATAENGQTATCVVTITDSPFTDVTDPNAYYYNAVLWANEKNITNGYGSTTTFCPDVICTRGQIVTFLWRAAGSPEPTSSVNPFTDVAVTDYFYKAVLWAVEKGITAGYGTADIFNPNGNCTRGQVATFLHRYFNKPAPTGSNPFNDVVAGEYYCDAVLWAVEQGITNGYGDTGGFAPNMDCNRAQIVTFLYRAIG